jgi:hypothetical protein
MNLFNRRPKELVLIPADMQSKFNNIQYDIENCIHNYIRYSGKQPDIIILNQQAYACLKKSMNNVKSKSSPEVKVVDSYLGCSIAVLMETEPSLTTIKISVGRTGK